MIAGPYGLRSQPPGQRRLNLIKLELAARAIHDKGHVPVVGLNLALPVASSVDEPFWRQDLSDEQCDLVDRLSLAATERCDAVVRLPGASTGADAEVEAFRARGKPIYSSIDEVPDAL